jgi:hypothetical protein
LESFPIGQGAAAPLRSPGVYEGRGTKDERRKTGVWAETRIATASVSMTVRGGFMLKLMTLPPGGDGEKLFSR